MTTSPTAAAPLLERTPTQLFIDGEFVDATGGATFDVLNPATGEVLCAVADATPADGRRALDAAVAAQADFAATTPLERHGILLRAYELLMQRQDELGLLMTLEMGKPLAEAKGEIAYAAEFFRHFAGEALRIDGSFQSSPQGGARFLVTKQPVGPCLLITPWNFPMAMGTRKIGPAVAAGCTMVVKPAKLTPLSMLALADILDRAGLPAGVLNVITASSAGDTTGPLIEDPRLRKLTFTGSTEVGRKLIAASGENVLRVSMELGGNAPFIVFEDADLEAAVDGAMLAKTRNVGEACTAANRFHVAASVAEEFSKRFAEKMGALKVGRGTEDDTDLGPLVDDDTRAKVAELVEDAVGKGAKTLTGGNSHDGPGYFYDPTVLSEVPDDARLLTEEIFGP
ncbi:MAG: aldehyde dehydrogenase family protein, partial [Ornithinimicrobium sp.]|uniref:aldehyde dehydrogenase family protein n=1 Tax=Ornithinimicrobium sp. TaxID=1977084 RepID=UPI003D9BF25B